MSDRSDEGVAIRSANATSLAQALAASRRDTLATFAAYERALDKLTVPQRPGLNPPLWEIGHVGWFQEFWIARNPERRLGAAADPQARRGASAVHAADELYDSSRIAHADRWTAPLPDAHATRAMLAAQLETTLTLLHEADNDDASLYFYRLALLHEDMHHEAALYMANALGIPIADRRWKPCPLPEGCAQLAFDPGTWALGTEAQGFAFDNELAAHIVELPACRVDSRVVRWAEYLPFVEAGGYDDGRWWTEEGRRWLATTGARHPLYLKRSGSGWQRWDGSGWTALDPTLPACHVCQHEALAWCNWAGRRLPTEAEWERAAVEAADEFRWGDVWEWTASEFAPYPGFVAHPYRDYSLPWFDDRPVLRGASFATQPRIRHPRYRNYFPADRNDVFAGFRTCELGPGSRLL